MDSHRPPKASEYLLLVIGKCHYTKSKLKKLNCSADEFINIEILVSQNSIELINRTTSYYSNKTGMLL